MPIITYNVVGVRYTPKSNPGLTRGVVLGKRLTFFKYLSLKVMGFIVLFKEMIAS